MATFYFFNTGLVHVDMLASVQFLPWRFLNVFDPELNS